MFQQPLKRDDGLVKGANLWRVGFSARVISAISLLSGLVDVHETVWLPEQGALVFVVTNRDKTGTLFRTGVLRACPIEGYQPNLQPLAVDWANGKGFASGGN